MVTVKIKLEQTTHGPVKKSYQGTKWVTLYGDDGKVAKFNTITEAAEFVQNRVKKFPNAMKIIDTKFVNK